MKKKYHYRRIAKGWQLALSISSVFFMIAIGFTLIFAIEKGTNQVIPHSPDPSLTGSI